MKILTSLLCLLSFKLMAQTPEITPSEFTLSVQEETARVLNIIGEELSTKSQEIALYCQNQEEQKSRCLLKTTPEVRQDQGPLMEVDLINRPFTNDLMLLRLHSGNQNTLETIYQAIENYAVQRPFKPNVTERVLELEEAQVRIRCISEDKDNSEKPQFDCWVLIRADILDGVDMPLYYNEE